eukprot:6764074-Heterocapsa_arctica.AAC.1
MAPAVPFERPVQTGPAAPFERPVSKTIVPTTLTRQENADRKRTFENIKQPQQPVRSWATSSAWTPSSASASASAPQLPAQLPARLPAGRGQAGRPGSPSATAAAKSATFDPMSAMPGARAPFDSG